MHFETRGAAPSGRRWLVDARSASRWQRRLLALTLSLAGLACLVLAQRLWGLQGELAHATGTLQSMTASTTTMRSAGSVSRPAMSPSERAAWARLASALNTPWNSVFDTLERAFPTDVALISIEPDATTSSLRLEAEAPTLAALLSGAQALGADGGVAQVALAKHETQDQDPNRPVRLQMDIRLQRVTP
ncbi:hypothetical protein [Hydrogenophaga sp.]|uniref:hypothetical protein n=1 Tax=Hydrogenophaga sp. TaxID=1904254 RepID=UPI002FC73399